MRIEIFCCGHSYPGQLNFQMKEFLDQSGMGEKGERNEFSEEGDRRVFGILGKFPPLLRLVDEVRRSCVVFCVSCWTIHM
jgi:hypothetical protein